jgi:transcription initiation factor TFIIIB Brf1 subunit/transcription initiation factor TFIIB
MTDKLTGMKRRFIEMYENGTTYREICAELGISILTAHGWRKRLGLPPRRERRAGPLSWMDVRHLQGQSPREILEKVAGPLKLSRKDIEFILVRVEKLKSKGLHRGRSLIHLILAAAYLYVRWEGSGKQPVSPKNFERICHNSGFKLGRRNLLMLSRLFTEAALYPATCLKPQQLLDRMWISLREELHLPEEVKSKADKLIVQFKFVGRSPEVAVAGCLYAAVVAQGIRSVTQKLLAEMLGVTEVSVRNAWHLISPSLAAEDRATSHEDGSKMLPHEPDGADAHVLHRPASIRIRPQDMGKRNLLVCEIEGHVGGYCAHCSKCSTHSREATHFVLFSPSREDPDLLLAAAVCSDGKEFHSGSPSLNNVKGFVPITGELLVALQERFPRRTPSYAEWRGEDYETKRKEVAQFISKVQERVKGGDDAE